MKRKICLILAILMLLTVVFGTSACKKNDEGETGETTVSTTTGGDGGAEDNSLYADLPKANYNGYTFNILVSESDYAITTICPEDTTDSLNQAMFNRNSFVKDTLNINIVEESLEFPAFTKVQEEMRRLNTANTFTYDAVFN